MDRVVGLRPNGGVSRLLIGMIHQVRSPNGEKKGVTPSLLQIAPFLWVPEVTTLYEL